MNYIFKENNNVLSSILQAAAKPELWDAALKTIAKACNAKSAIITLRSKHNCEVVISSEIENEFHTPFVAMLSEEHVENYVNNFRNKDVWSHQQVNNRPFAPILMSNKLPMCSLQKTDFWNWLEPQGINDTVVVQLGESKHYWTALNLYFDNNNAEDAKKKQQYIQNLLPDLKSAWQLTRDQLYNTAIKDQFIDHVEQHNEAIFLLDQDNLVVSYSKHVEPYIAEGMCKVCNRTKRLSVAQSIHKVDDTLSWLYDVFTQNTASLSNVILKTKTTSSIAATGEALGFHIVSIEKIRTTHPWEAPHLDEREKIAILSVAKTNKVSSVEGALNLKERQARSIWRTAVNKLGNIKKADLVHIYQKSLN